ncbi:receptor-like serine/threonine-protein kinase ALE2 [Iris pallida]|uniref:Receptor-like serine/threonine-protein kinase ALE2 n=1 Tax=Iris pallida TaxID=29817 RepID=A0AAX6DLL0_IRIPA|nr:receptor-like serine/threonine-protein kinase ALE2 [Iris pallida]
MTTMSVLVVVVLSLLTTDSLVFARQPLIRASALFFPAKMSMISLTPTQAPAFSPESHGTFPRPYVSKHHRHKKFPHAVPPTTFAQPQEPDGCDEVTCVEPLTFTPIGSPCACILPMQVQIDLGVAPYQLFSRIAELEVEVASGTFLKQSQVRIMGATASTRDPERTTVTVDLVPLGEKFDSMTALLTYQRFWEKRVQINMTIFGDYEVIYVNYPGLPSSPPTTYGSSLGPSVARPHQDPLSANTFTSKKQKINPTTIAVIAFSSSILLFMCFGVACIFWRRREVGKAPAGVGSAFTSSFTRKNGVRSTKSTSVSISVVPTLPTCPSSVKTFSISELEKATDKFSSRKVLGEGGFGRVYLGVLEDGSEVAIKLLTREGHNGDREFIAEVEMLSRLHHRNLVKLVGICIEGRKRCLVYELIRNGSVESHLHGADKIKAPLDWDTRMKIALGAARGLAYLHEDSNPRVIHRDFKASNVLLEEDFTPKVSDFGLAREASEGIYQISTRFMGTFGYVAPEYAMTGHLLVKSDVYSYGVVLLELLSGRKPVDISQPRGPENLVTWARPLLTTREGIEQLVDPSLGPNCDFDTMAKVAAIASLCVHAEAGQRPFMGEVVQALKLIYNDTDETCGDSCSQMEESLGPDCDFKGDLGGEGSWWSGSTPHVACNYASSFVTMEYSSGLVDEMERHHSENLSGTQNRSGPLRTKRYKSAFHRLRGSMSEHGHQPSRHSGFDGYLG